VGILGVRRVKTVNRLMEALSVGEHGQSPLATGDEMWGALIHWS
jgi:hypothetical protein